MRRFIGWTILLLAAFVTETGSTPPNLIHYQGMLTDSSGDAITGSRDLTFSIHSSATPQPTTLWSEVHLDVTIDSGLFNVALGSTIPFPEDLFNSGDRWLGIEVDGVMVSPLTQLVSVPWALNANRAAVADSVIGGSGGGGADNDWVVIGSDMHAAPGGNVGIGISAPATKLDVLGIIRGTRVAGSEHYIQMNHTDWTGSYLTAHSEERNKKSLRVQSLFAETGDPSGHSSILFRVGPDSSPLDAMMIKENGNVGIGTTDPLADLHITRGGAYLLMESGNQYGSVIELKNDSTVDGVDRGKIRFTDDDGAIRAEIESSDFGSLLSWLKFSVAGAIRMSIDQAGQVGIGTVSPQTTLHLDASESITRLESDANHGAFLQLQGMDEEGQVGYTYGAVQFMDHAGNVEGEIRCSGSTAFSDGIHINAGGTLGIKVADGGKVGIGTTDPSEALTVRGNILIEDSSGDPVVELGEGLDYAEGFDVSHNSETPPGSVLVIDSANPGKLAMSTRAYDTRVAGIVAGANGLGSGVRLGVGNFDCDVALAGRVYCDVDASGGDIQAGDLLTTSSIPGHAMKATDAAKSRGAILGKAMEPLSGGSRGRILVLVTLQ